MLVDANSKFIIPVLRLSPSEDQRVFTSPSIALMATFGTSKPFAVTFGMARGEVRQLPSEFNT